MSGRADGFETTRQRCSGPVGSAPAGRAPGGGRAGLLRSLTLSGGHPRLRSGGPGQALREQCQEGTLCRFTGDRPRRPNPPAPFTTTARSRAKQLGLGKLAALTLHVFSEVDPLRRVLVHRPGLEIDWMTPTLMGQLLFDDILDGEEARQEHDTFCAVLERAGAELVEPQRLLAEVLAGDGARDELLRELERDFDVEPEVVERLGGLEAEELAAALVHGVRAPAEAAASRRQAIFDLPPIPNFFFQRDAQVVLGDRTIVCSMATAAREREQLVARFLCARHPALAGAARFEIERPPSGAPDHDPHFPYPTLEGGDVVVASRDTVLVGAGQRTNRRGVEILAEYLRREPAGFRHLVMVELPPRRSCMHPDTVFNFIDRDTCLAYRPVV